MCGCWITTVEAKNQLLFLLLLHTSTLVKQQPQMSCFAQFNHFAGPIWVKNQNIWSKPVLWWRPEVSKVKNKKSGQQSSFQEVWKILLSIYSRSHCFIQHGPRVFLKEIAQIPQSNMVFIRNKHLMHAWKPRSSNQFLPLVTLNKNNWVAKYINWFCFYYSCNNITTTLIQISRLF